MGYGDACEGLLIDPVRGTANLVGPFITRKVVCLRWAIGLYIFALIRATWVNCRPEIRPARPGWSDVFGRRDVGAV